LIILYLVLPGIAFSQDSENVHFKFDFGSGIVEPGYEQVLPAMKYTPQRGFGFLTDSLIESVQRDDEDPLKSDFCTAKDPFIFAVDVPEGNYDIFVTLGDKVGKSITTIKAESRRLMLEKVSTDSGEFKKVVFTTNVRYAQIDSVTSVKLKPREIYHFNWDKSLSIEFNDRRPCVCAVEIEPAKNPVTIYLAGNSTVTDQKAEPWAAWGQMLPRFFQPQKVVVANHAESGESLKSFISENRLKKIFSTIKAGDYLFIQFCHNDQKPHSPSYLEPFSGYKEYLKLFIDKAREVGAVPVLIMPMHRRTFAEDGQIVNSHGDYPEAMRQVSVEENVPLIDLFSMSARLFKALGIEGSKRAFVHYPAGSFPGQEKAIMDDTHFSNYGAYQLAKCVVEGIKENNLELEKYLLNDLQSYDPLYPDSFENWDLPVSPMIPSL
jgi:lysophospholipase L1-like esterase